MVYFSQGEGYDEKWPLSQHYFKRYHEFYRIKEFILTHDFVFTI
jgi:hypothetical protein